MADAIKTKRRWQLLCVVVVVVVGGGGGGGDLRETRANE